MFCDTPEPASERGEHHRQSPAPTARGQRRDRRGLRTQDARAEATPPAPSPAPAAAPARLRKSRPPARSGSQRAQRPFRCRKHAKQRVTRTRQRLVAEDEAPLSGPVAEHAVKALDRRTSGTKVPPHCSAASTAWACSWSCRMRSALVKSVCTGRMRATPSSTAFSTMKSVRAFLIGAKISQRSGGCSCSGRSAASQQQRSAALAGLGHLGRPFAVAPVEEQHDSAGRQPHHGEEIMRLIPVERNRLPLPQRVLYKKPDFRDAMRPTYDPSPQGMPEPTRAARRPVADAAPRQLGRPAARRPGLRPYLRLVARDRPIGTWLLLLPCWWGVALAALRDGGLHWCDVWIVVGCAVGAWLMRGAGCTWNDITDRDIDAARGAHPLAADPVGSGQRSGRRWRWMVVQARRRLRDPADLQRGGHRAGHRLAGARSRSIPSPSGSPGGRRSFSGSPSTGARCWPGPRIPARARLASLLLYLAGIAWTLFYDTIYAHQDTEDDALIGVKSTARLFGRATSRWLFVFSRGDGRADDRRDPGGRAGDGRSGQAGRRARGALGARLAPDVADADSRHRRQRRLPQAVSKQS